MKKYLVFTFLLITLHYSFGQKIDWGIQVGGGVSNQYSNLNNFNSSKDTYDYLNRPNSWSPSFNFDVVLNTEITHRFGLGTGLGYIRKGSTTKKPEVTSQLDYIHLPILISYKLVNRWSLVAGPEIGYRCV